MRRLLSLLTATTQAALGVLTAAPAARATPLPAAYSGSAEEIGPTAPVITSPADGSTTRQPDAADHRKWAGPDEFLASTGGSPGWLPLLTTVCLIAGGVTLVLARRRARRAGSVDQGGEA